MAFLLHKFFGEKGTGQVSGTTKPSAQPKKDMLESIRLPRTGTIEGRGSLNRTSRPKDQYVNKDSAINQGLSISEGLTRKSKVGSRPYPTYAKDNNFAKHKIVNR